MHGRATGLDRQVPAWLGNRTLLPGLESNRVREVVHIVNGQSQPCGHKGIREPEREEGEKSIRVFQRVNKKGEGGSIQRGVKKKKADRVLNWMQHCGVVASERISDLTTWK